MFKGNKPCPLCLVRTGTREYHEKGCQYTVTMGWCHGCFGTHSIFNCTDYVKRGDPALLRICSMCKIPWSTGAARVKSHPSASTNGGCIEGARYKSWQLCLYCYWHKKDDVIAGLQVLGVDRFPTMKDYQGILLQSTSDIPNHIIMMVGLMKRLSPMWFTDSVL